MGEICVLDLDLNHEQKKFIRIAGEKIYYKKVPVMTTILYEQTAIQGKEMKTQEDAKEVMEKAARAVLITLNYGRKEKLTEEWLYERCEYSDISKILSALHEPIKKNIPEGPEVDQ
jgi:hypothetical protein